MYGTLNTEVEAIVKFRFSEKGYTDTTPTKEDAGESMVRGIKHVLESEGLENIEVELVNCEIEWIPKGVTFNE